MAERFSFISVNLDIDGMAQTATKGKHKEFILVTNILLVCKLLYSDYI